MAGAPQRAWPPGEAYRYLETAGRADLAWEWLRRDFDFRRLAPSVTREVAGGIAIAETASPESEARWGCIHIPDPGLRFTDTPVLWSADVDPSVLRVIASPASVVDGPAFDLRRWGAAATLVTGAQGRESLLLRNAGCGGLRLDVISGSLLQGPVALLFEFGRRSEIELAIAALRRYYHLCCTGEFPAVSFHRNQRFQRQIQALCVHDALAQGASIRDVGTMLFGGDRVRVEWPGQGDALKSHCRRMIALVRFMAAGGYKTLLRFI